MLSTVDFVVGGPHDHILLPLDLFLDGRVEEILLLLETVRVHLVVGDVARVVATLERIFLLVIGLLVVRNTLVAHASSPQVRVLVTGICSSHPTIFLAELVPHIVVRLQLHGASVSFNL